MTERSGRIGPAGSVGDLLRRPATALTRMRRVVRRATARVPRDPVIVLGNQKSGTSAIAGLLGLAADVPARIDIPRANKRGQWRPLAEGRLDFDGLVRGNREAFAHRIVKEPNLTLFADDVLRRFPAARLVFVVRDPRDNVRSILNRLGLPGDREELPAGTVAGLPDSWPLVVDGRWIGIDGDTYVDRLAGRWNRMVDTWRRHRERMILVRYEDFMVDRVAAIERLAESVGLPVRRDVSTDVDRRFQPPGDRGVRWLDFFGAANLERIEGRCREGMEELGYAASDRGPGPADAGGAGTGGMEDRPCASR